MLVLDPEIFDIEVTTQDVCTYIQKNMMVYQKPLGSYVFVTFQSGEILFSNDRRKLIQEKLSILRKAKRMNTLHLSRKGLGPELNNLENNALMKKLTAAYSPTAANLNVELEKIHGNKVFDSFSKDSN